MICVTFELPVRVASLRAAGLGGLVSRRELACCAITMLNPDFIIESYNPRYTSTPIRKLAAEFCRHYAWMPFPFNAYYGCADVSLTGTAVVLHNAKSYD